MTPETIARWLWTHEAILVEASGSPCTCSAGQGNAYDYAIMHPHFRHFLEELQVVHAVPWAPHVALRLRMKLEPANVMVRELRIPRAFQLPPVPSKHGHQGQALWAHARACDCSPAAVTLLLIVATDNINAFLFYIFSTGDMSTY